MQIELNYFDICFGKKMKEQEVEMINWVQSIFHGLF